MWRLMSVRSVQGLSLLSLATLLLGCGIGPAHSSADSSGPVIPRVADAQIPYPLASVNGRLSLQDGCLMIGHGVVFWPAGTSWDGTKREVVFGGDFTGSPNAAIDSTFSGGGGLFDLNDDVGDVLTADAQAALRACVRQTGATYVLLAYPDKP